MAILSNIVAYIGGYLSLVFVAVCLATGLYYLAAMVEEYTRVTKKVLTWARRSLLHARRRPARRRPAPLPLSPSPSARSAFTTASSDASPSWNSPARNSSAASMLVATLLVADRDTSATTNG